MRAHTCNLPYYVGGVSGKRRAGGSPTQGNKDMSFELYILKVTFSSLATANY